MDKRTIYISFKNWVIITLLAIITGLSLYTSRMRKAVNQISANPSEEAYLTDTVYMDAPLEVVSPVKGSKILNPSILRIYQTDTVRVKESEIVYCNDSTLMLIDRYENTIDSILFSYDYLKQFPKNNKLLDLRLSEDSLKVAFLDIQGTSFQEEYPLFLNKYNYRFYQNDIYLIQETTEKKAPPKNKGNRVTYYLTGDYELASSMPRIGTEFNFKVWRVVLVADGKLAIQEFSQSQLSVGIKVDITNGR